MITSGWWGVAWWCGCLVAAGVGLGDFLVCGKGVWEWDVGLVGVDLEGVCGGVDGDGRPVVWCWGL